MNLLQNSQYSWNIFFFRRSIRILLELVHRTTQNFAIIDEEKHKIDKFSFGGSRGERGGSYFPYILLNEIQTMFSQLAKRSARVLPADLCTDHAHYVKNHRFIGFERNKIMAAQGGTVSHYYILVNRKFFGFMSLFRHSVWFSFSVK